jgi:hypothetical protein
VRSQNCWNNAGVKNSTRFSSIEDTLEIYRRWCNPTPISAPLAITGDSSVRIRRACRRATAALTCERLCEPLDEYSDADSLRLRR